MGSLIFSFTCPVCVAVGAGSEQQSPSLVLLFMPLDKSPRSRNFLKYWFLLNYLSIFIWSESMWLSAFKAYLKCV